MGRGPAAAGLPASGWLEDVSPLVPPPSEWATSGVPMLAEAVAFIEELVNNSEGFMNGPDGEADDWRFIRGKIVADDGTVNYEGIEQVSGRHFQHVANNALQQDMFNAIVDNPSVGTERRARTSARRSSSERARCSASTSSAPPSNCTTRRGSRRRRATSTTPRAPSPLRHAAPAWALRRSRLPGCIPCNIGKAQEPRTLSLFEHLNDTHWDGCNYGGWEAARQAAGIAAAKAPALCFAFARVLRQVSVCHSRRTLPRCFFIGVSQLRILVSSSSSVGIAWGRYVFPYH